MAPPPLLCSASRNIILLSLLLFLLVSTCISASSHSQLQSKQLSRARRMLEVEDKDPPPKKKTTGQSQSLKNQTKLIKPKLTSSKNQTKTIPSNNVSSKNQTKKTIQSNTLSTAKNQTKLLKVSSSKNQTKLLKASSSKTQAKLVDTGLKKLNSTSKIKMLNSTSKPSNSTKIKTAPISSKKSLDLLPKTSDAKNKTIKPAAAIQTKSKSSDQSSKSSKNQKASPQKPKKQTLPSWIDSDDDDDFVADLKDLPTKFQQTLIPDLKTISTTSRAYITKANKEITKGFKPYVGNKYASTVATVLSCAFALIPLLLVSLIFNKIKAYFSIQRLLIFVQIYLSIYFSILCLSALITGLEPLKFFYSTSQSTYVCLQVLQTLGYLFYLLLLLMHLILVFSAESGMGSKFLGLAQTFLGLAIGLHYYVTVFHRVVLRQPPKTNWKIHGIYAACFLLICVLAGAERRKKAYLEDGGEEGKKS